MALLDMFRRSRQPVQKRESDNVSSPDFWWQPGLQGVTEVSDPSGAMKIAAAYRCIDILSKEVALLPLEVLKNRGGYYTLDEGNPLNRLLSLSPNPDMNAYDLFRNAIIQYLVHGNAVIVPEFGPRGWSKLVLTCPYTVVFDKNTKQYIVNDYINGVYGTYRYEDVIHLKNLSLDGGFWGSSTISYAATTLGIAANADKEHVEAFRNGGTLRGFVSGNNASTVGFGALQDQQLNDVADTVEKQLASGRSIFSLPGEMRFNQISLSPKDIELLQTKQFTVVDVCRFFGVHPDKVFAQQTANYKASEMSQVAFLTDTLQPLLRQIEVEFTAKLLPADLIGRYRIAFNLEGLMQTDLATKAAYMDKTIATGTYTINYWRMRNGQAPVDGGDTPLVSANLIPINSAKLWGEPQGDLKGASE